MKYLKIITVISLSAVFCFMSCSDDSNTLIQLTGFSAYPLKIGNQWQYEHEIAVVNFQPSVPDTPFPGDTLILGTSTVEAVRMQTLPGGTETYVLHETFRETNQIWESEFHYRNEEDGLFIYATLGANSQSLPKSTSNPAKTRIQFIGKEFNSLPEMYAFFERALFSDLALLDTLVIENPPLQVLPFPTEVGQVWAYREKGNPFLIEKSVIGKETVEVPAGEFECFKIQWDLDFDNDGTPNQNIEFVDYISARGLVKRTLIFRGLVITSETGPEPVGSFDSQHDVLASVIQLN